jgi:hypothetical protein
VHDRKFFQQSCRNVGFCSSTQPTNFKFFQLNRAVLRYQRSQRYINAVRIEIVHQNSSSSSATQRSPSQLLKWRLVHQPFHPNLAESHARWKSGNPRNRKTRYPTVKKRSTKPRKNQLLRFNIKARSYFWQVCY